ncbi:MAG: PQQ-binding-like beta-propeller repeat protein [Verrucomicrobia bacterium]|nr:PQQ-binding-like beta-propeller repeat protein [Verrucomicrobiota bacterium]
MIPITNGRHWVPWFSSLLSLLACTAAPARPVEAGHVESLFAHTNLVAWCIVPFDGKKRGPEERAAMLQRLGFKHFAYDYRAEHVPTFDAEVEALKRHGVELSAWWFPTTLDSEAKLILDVLKRHQVHPDLWVMGGGDPARNPEEQQSKVTADAARIKSIAEAAREVGCRVALYNHGGWFGEPENQVAIIEQLRAGGITNVGIVYNLHHGHGHLDRLPALLQRIKPYLWTLNLNGMDKDGDKINRLILPIGQGELDLAVWKTIVASGWTGPVGILNHTDEDAEGRLRDNLDGLDWLVGQLEGKPPAPKPKPRTWRDYWAVEDKTERERLPLLEVIPAATPQELTPANGSPNRKVYTTWQRSHGDNGGTRFSALTQINRKNVTNLQVAWTYHTGDGMNNIQCNPIIVEGVLFAPTPGKFVVAINAETGKELWRFKPEGRPAFRGLTYWPGQGEAAPRLLFCSGPFLYALNPANGKPIETFGEVGKAKLPGRAQGDFGAATAGPAVFDHIIIVPGFEKDVWGLDVVTGALLWTFHTVPHPGEYGYETWDRTEEYAANCWGGMALDDTRGIAYITTASPKPNFIGVLHRGQNLFANCLIALDARTGKRLWHFQEIRHDIWDLDLPAPPNLGTITREGKRIDIVAAATKIGNTLLLDRVTGKPIFPFRLRRAPTSTLRGEETWPYQPDPELPERFSKMEYTAADLTERTEEAADFARTRFKSASTGFFQPPGEGRPTLYFGIDGGAEWTGACIDQDTGRLYVTASHIGWIISLFRDQDPAPTPTLPGRLVYERNCAQCHATNLLGISIAPPLLGLRHRLTAAEVTRQIREGRNGMPSNPNLTESDLNALLDYLMLRDRGPIPPATARAERPSYGSTGYPKFYDPEGYPANKPPWGTLNCIDLNTGKLLWKVPHGEYPELTARGMAKTGTENYGGAIVTAGGLVICSGTRDNKIRAYDKDTGAELWSAKLPYVGNAPPATTKSMDASSS